MNSPLIEWIELCMYYMYDYRTGATYFCLAVRNLEIQSIFRD